MNKFLIVICSMVFAYTVIGTKGDVEKIKSLAPDQMKERNWDVLRYEGWQYGSWGNHGGKVWYHVKDKKVKNVYYRVYVTYWDGELHYTYGAPEALSRIDANVDIKS